MSKKEVKQTFEQSLRKLEKIVQALEQGDVALEESLKMYEEGIQLSRECMETLGKAEVKIKQLTKDLNGKLQLSDVEE
jgi:exodeoxyribonuclease VII small subunit